MLSTAARPGEPSSPRLDPLRDSGQNAPQERSREQRYVYLSAPQDRRAPAAAATTSCASASRPRTCPPARSSFASSSHSRTTASRTWLSVRSSPQA
eukprot:2153601-Pyramimonas_sp.AAC.1